MAIYTKLHRRTGVKFYYIRYARPDGKRRAEVAGTTRRQAERKLVKRLGEVASGEWTDPRDAGRQAGPTFAEFADRFLADYGSLRKSDHYTGRLRPAAKEKEAGILRAHFGDKLLRGITRADLDAFAALRARQVGASTLRKDLITLGTIFKMAVRWGVLEASPAVDLAKPSEPVHRTRYLSAEEWGRFEAACPPWLRPIATVAVATGMRLKEVVGLTWDDVDREAGLIHVPEDTKTGTRPVPLSRAVREVLDGQVRRVRSPFVFHDPAGETFTSREARLRITRATIAAAKRAKVAGATFHSLRHTAASWMVQSGVDLYEVQRILGHSTPAMTQRYAFLQPDHLRRGVEAIDAVLAGRATQTATQGAVVR